MENKDFQYRQHRSKLQEVPENKRLILKKNNTICVYMFIQGNHQYVIKRVHRFHRRKYAQREQIFCKRLIDKKYFVKIHDVWINQPYLYICMDFYHMDLKNFILKKSELLESQPQIGMKLFLQLLFALTELGVMHRDIKPQNIFVKDKQQQVQLFLADFGECSKGQAYVQSYVGTEAYQAPQVQKNCIQYTVYNRKADIWSFGMTFYQILCGKNKLKSQNYEFLRKPWEQCIDIGEDIDLKQIYKSRKSQHIILRKSIPSFMREIIRKMLKLDPVERWNYSQIYTYLQQNQDKLQNLLQIQSNYWIRQINKYKKLQKDNILHYQKQQQMMESIKQIYKYIYKSVQKIKIDGRYHKLVKLLYYAIDQLKTDYQTLLKQYFVSQQILDRLIDNCQKQNILIFRINLANKIGFICSKKQLKTSKNRQNLQQHLQNTRVFDQLRNQIPQPQIQCLKRVFRKHIINRLSQ